MAGLRLGDGKCAPLIIVSQNNGTNVSAINKSGTKINVGDKVWLNKQMRETNSAFVFNGSEQTPTYRGIISNDGQYGYCSGKVYSVNSDSSLELANGSTYNDRMRVVYGANGLTFVGDIGLATTSTSCGVSNYYNKFISANTSYIASNGSNPYIYRISPSDYSITRMSLNGDVMKTWTYNGNIVMPMCPFMIGNTIYSYQCTSQVLTYWTIDDSSNTYSATNILSPIGHTIGITSDSKYILSANNSNDMYGAVGSLKLYRVNSSVIPARFTEISLPESMLYFQGSSVESSAYVFNPHNNILTAVDWRDITNVMVKVYRYLPSLESWEELSINLPELDGLYYCGCLTLSEDASRACINVASGSSAHMSLIINLTSVSEYAAVPYRYYTITENTIIGKATSVGEIGSEFNVATIIV